MVENDKKIHECINKLVTFSETKLQVKINLNSNMTCYYQNKKTILIHHRQKPLTKCFSLLHELGHVIQPVSPYRLSTNKICVIKSLILQQEISAWELGWGIAKDLGLDKTLNKQDYFKESAKFIASYIKYVNRADDVELLIESTAYKTKDINK